MTQPHIIDVLIAGQGAAAYAAALYAARYQMDLMMASEMFGGETAIGGTIENYPGHPEIDGFELMMKMQEQVKRYDAPIRSANLVSAARVGDCFESRLSDGSTVHSTALILAIGRERRKLGLPHEDEWTGKGVSYCSTCDAPLFRNKRVVVVGGGNAAVEGAVLLGKYAAEVYIVYRRAKFTRPERVLVDLLDQSENVRQVLGTNVVELIGDETGIRAVRLDHPCDGSDTIDVDGIFIEIGADPRVAIARSLGVELNRETNEVHVNRMMQTSVEGVFAAGDLTDGSGPLKQTITAAAQGAVAALSAYTYVAAHPGRCLRHEKGMNMLGSE